MMGLRIEGVRTFTDNYVWMLHDESTGQTAAVDPGHAEPVLAYLDRRGWRLDWILNTHHHGDHTGGNLELKAMTGCRICGAHRDRHRIPGIDVALHDNDGVTVGASHAQVLWTPGHTSGHVCFWFDRDQALFCGDTLFSLGCGRLMEGDARTMLMSLNRLAALPTETLIYCAHEYTRVNGQFARSVDPDNPALLRRIDQVESLCAADQPTVPQRLGLELESNPFLRTANPEIARRIGLPGESPEVVFAALRARKDSFGVDRPEPRPRFAQTEPE